MRNIIIIWQCSLIYHVAFIYNEYLNYIIEGWINVESQDTYLNSSSNKFCINKEGKNL